jgi:hypothetical protein
MQAPLTEWGLAAESLQSPEPSKSMGATPWVAGGLILLAVLGVYALETKGPAPFRRQTS